MAVLKGILNVPNQSMNSRAHAGLAAEKHKSWSKVVRNRKKLLIKFKKLPVRS
jgi:hypothetical protein